MANAPLLSLIASDRHCELGTGLEGPTLVG
jgi:hypothetical protein